VALKLISVPVKVNSIVSPPVFPPVPSLVSSPAFPPVPPPHEAVVTSSARAAINKRFFLFMILKFKKTVVLAAHAARFVSRAIV
jgi:hypothetical protein